MKQNNYLLPAAAEIVRIERDNLRTKTFVLDASIDAYPGQFVMLWLPGFDEKPFSLVNNDPVTLMITEVGPFTDLVHRKAVGDPLWIRGPFGHGFSVPDAGSHALLVGGGYGVAPLLWLAREMSGHMAKVSTVVGARSAPELLYLDRFQSLSESGEISEYDLYVTTDDGSTGVRGYVTTAVQALLQEVEVDAIYACGPEGMLTALSALALQHRIPCQLSWEAYMRCGIGLCGSCEHNNALLCMDGPVLHVAP